MYFSFISFTTESITLFISSLEEITASAVLGIALSFPPPDTETR